MNLLKPSEMWKEVLMFFGYCFTIGLMIGIGTAKMSDCWSFVRSYYKYLDERICARKNGTDISEFAKTDAAYTIIVKGPKHTYEASSSEEFAVKVINFIINRGKRK